MPRSRVARKRTVASQHRGIEDSAPATQNQELNGPAYLPMRCLSLAQSGSYSVFTCAQYEPHFIHVAPTPFPPDLGATMQAGRYLTSTNFQI